MLPDEVDGPFGADSLDGAAVVAAKQNAKVYELKKRDGGGKMQWNKYLQKKEAWLKARTKKEDEKLYLFVCEADVLQHMSQVELLNRKFPK